MCMIKRTILLLLFIGIAFGQDSYSYFSDLLKQLEFEDKRLFIKEVHEKEIYINVSGDKFNYWKILDKSVSKYRK